jgi:tetratricopeptide (TPR) repeat protein
LLFSNKKKFYYKGVLHEFVSCDEKFSKGKARGIKVIVNTDGKRSMDENKFEKDSKLLEETLKKEKDPHMVSRYTFYLAQSYRDCGNLVKAIESYKKRTTLGFFEQEIFESLYNITKAKAKLNYPIEEVVDAGLKAYSFKPERIEPMHEIVKYCRLREQFNLGYFLGKEYIDFSHPEEALFKIHWVYDWGFWDEVAVCAFYSDKKSYAIDLWKRALNNKIKMPDAEIDRINKNIDCAIKNE